MPVTDDTVTELRDKLLLRLNLTDVDPLLVTSQTPLFQDGLGLDSLDALEITVLVEEEYGIVINVAERDRAVFGTLGDLARFICANRGRDLPAPAGRGAA